MSPIETQLALEDRRQWFVRHGYPGAVANLVHEPCEVAALALTHGVTLSQILTTVEFHECNPVVINEDDLSFDYYHSGVESVIEGPRGVAMTYKPTGRTFFCSSHPSQLENKANVLKQLKASLR